MGPLVAEEAKGIRTKGQQVGGVQNKRAGNAVSVSTLCCSRLYCHEKGIMKTINKAYWARERLKFWDGGGKKKQKGMPADVADGSICAFPPPHTFLDYRHPCQSFPSQCLRSEKLQ